MMPEPTTYRALMTAAAAELMKLPPSKTYQVAKDHRIGVFTDASLSSCLTLAERFHDGDELYAALRAGAEDVLFVAFDLLVRSQSLAAERLAPAAVQLPRPDWNDTFELAAASSVERAGKYLFAVVGPGTIISIMRRSIEASGRLPNELVPAFAGAPLVVVLAVGKAVMKYDPEVIGKILYRRDLRTHQAKVELLAMLERAPASPCLTSALRDAAAKKLAKAGHPGFHRLLARIASQPGHPLVEWARSLHRPSQDQQGRCQVDRRTNEASSRA